jgi:predicted kinase
VKKEVEVVDMPSLIIVTGIPGSGKTTFIKSHKASLKKYVHISRDEIRFQFLHGEDNYFKYEPQVLKEFYLQINKFLYLGFNVFADATHINAGSRRKLLNALKFTEGIDVRVIHVDTPIAETLARNELRKDTNRYVPTSVIKRMAHQFEEPMLSEGFSTIYTIRPHTKIEVRKETV